MRGGATGGGSGEEAGWNLRFQPENHRPDDAGSTRARATARARSREVAARVEEAVRQRVPHLARRAQDVQVVAVGEHAPAETEDPVHGSRERAPMDFMPEARSRSLVASTIACR